MRKTWILDIHWEEIIEWHIVKKHKNRRFYDSTTKEILEVPNWSNYKKVKRVISKKYIWFNIWIGEREIVK